MSQNHILKVFGWIDDSVQPDSYEEKIATKIIQCKLGVKVDGIFGPKTTEAFQNSEKQINNLTPITKNLSSWFSTAVLLDEKIDNWTASKDNLSYLALLIMSHAKKEFDAGAKEIGVNNGGEFVAKYHRKTVEQADELQWSWCAAFISWCIEQAEDVLDICSGYKYTGGAKNLFNQAVKKHGKKSNPSAGDIVCWDRGKVSWQGHVGIVVAVHEDVYVTLEGNKGNFPAKVQFYVYSLNNDPKPIGFAKI